MRRDIRHARRKTMRDATPKTRYLMPRHELSARYVDDVDASAFISPCVELKSDDYAKHF